jgi:hypothetical protein
LFLATGRIASRACLAAVGQCIRSKVDECTVSRQICEVKRLSALFSSPVGDHGRTERAVCNLFFLLFVRPPPSPFAATPPRPAQRHTHPLLRVRHRSLPALMTPPVAARAHDAARLRSAWPERRRRRAPFAGAGGEPVAFRRRQLRRRCCRWRRRWSGLTAAAVLPLPAVYGRSRSPVVGRLGRLGRSTALGPPLDRAGLACSPPSAATLGSMCTNHAGVFAAPVARHRQGRPDRSRAETKQSAAAPERAERWPARPAARRRGWRQSAA